MSNSCAFKRSKRQRLCSGDLDRYIEIQVRTLGAPPLGGGEATMTFTELKKVWAFIETLGGLFGGSRRFSGINIEDGATHLFYVRYDPDIFPLDSDNNFILYASRRYRILRVTEHNENQWYMILQCEETGISSKDGSGS